MRTNNLVKEMNEKLEKYSAARDIIDGFITSANWYLIDDTEAGDGSEKREPDMSNEKEHWNALRYEAYCAAIEAVRKWAEK